jgi:hypothetical protein
MMRTIGHKKPVTKGNTATQAAAAIDAWRRRRRRQSIYSPMHPWCLPFPFAFATAFLFPPGTNSLCAAQPLINAATSRKVYCETQFVGAFMNVLGDLAHCAFILASQRGILPACPLGLIGPLTPSLL